MLSLHIPLYTVGLNVCKIVVLAWIYHQKHFRLTLHEFGVYKISKLVVYQFTDEFTDCKRARLQKH